MSESLEKAKRYASLMHDDRRRPILTWRKAFTVKVGSKSVSYAVGDLVNPRHLAEKIGITHTLLLAFTDNPESRA
jgi:hypothetical protein